MVIAIFFIEKVVFHILYCLSGRIDHFSFEAIVMHIECWKHHYPSLKVTKFKWTTCLGNKWKNLQEYLLGQTLGSIFLCAQWPFLCYLQSFKKKSPACHLLTLVCTMAISKKFFFFKIRVVLMAETFCNHFSFPYQTIWRDSHPFVGRAWVDGEHMISMGVSGLFLQKGEYRSRQ